MSPASCLSPVSILLAIIKRDALDTGCYFVLFSPTEMSNPRIGQYLFYFGMTLLLETPIYWFASRQTYFARIAQILILNLATHPLVIYGFPFFMSLLDRPHWETVFLSEMFAWILEALLLTRFFGYSTGRAVKISMSANLVSWWVGLYVAPRIARLIW